MSYQRQISFPLWHHRVRLAPAVWREMRSPGSSSDKSGKTCWRYFFGMLTCCTSSKFVRDVLVLVLSIFVFRTAPDRRSPIDASTVWCDPADYINSHQLAARGASPLSAKRGLCTVKLSRSLAALRDLHLVYAFYTIACVIALPLHDGCRLLSTLPHVAARNAWLCSLTETRLECLRCR